ncbi:L-threonate dehydrogenase [Shinella sp.]|uniref:L-threonate dehydrogenase n=1 Tax=Shinella sp. TaxID=1870904 RepID=UPI003F72C964
MDDRRSAAVIGLGSMGAGMARALHRSGIRTAGTDVNAKALLAMERDGIATCRTPAEAAGTADIVIVVVVNAAQVEAVLFGEDGAVPAMQAGAVVICCATIAPEQAKAFAARAGEHGILYLDAPISGGAEKAAAGKLTVMASGPRQAFDAAAPALNAMAETVYDLGADVGIGSSFKMVNQHLAGIHIAAACEAITFAKSLGLDIAKVFEVITKSAGNSWMFENRVPHVLAGDYSPKSSVSIFTKDLGIVSDMARANKFPASMAGTALQLFLMCEAAGMGADDDASVARLLAGICKLDLPPEAWPQRAPADDEASSIQ